MTTTFLGFFVNRETRDEFVAPVIAADTFAARMDLQKVYPESRYMLLTVYSRQELEQVLNGVDRWPGMPNKAKEPVRADLSKVTARTGGLPPLPGQVKATVEKVATNEQPLPGWMQSLVTATPRADSDAPTIARSAATPAFAQPQQPANPILQAMAQPKTSLPPQSLIERLKAARGETMATPVRREAVPPQPEMPAGAITRQASGASVIDILKNMRK